MEYAVNIPCLIGDKIYKIRPKCNDNHDGSCEHCAWRGCHPHGCDVGVKVWFDGSFNNKPLQVIETKVGRSNFFTVLDYWNIMYFPTREEAERALVEYDAIRSIENRADRIERYQEWSDAREYGSDQFMSPEALES